ncbi:hypothetical protein MTO96_010917 [Rhipicephalus appendiculatus]
MPRPMTRRRLLGGVAGTVGGWSRSRLANRNPDDLPDENRDRIIVLKYNLLPMVVSTVLSAWEVVLMIFVIMSRNVVLGMLRRSECPGRRYSVRGHSEGDNSEQGSEMHCGGSEFLRVSESIGSW